MEEVQKVAIIAGATGISGWNLVHQLIEVSSVDWVVYGVSRKPIEGLPKTFKHVELDLDDAAKCREVLGSLHPPPTHAFFTTWTKKKTEDESCKANLAMFENFMRPLLEKRTLRHVALLTGAKHYMGAFDDQAAGFVPETPFREDAPRLPSANFYYVLEDALFVMAKDHGFTWSVSRPNSIIGFARGNLMNMGVSLAVYAAVCKHLNEPFVFPGTKACHDGIQEVSDARLVARQLEWCALEKRAANEAFNCANADVFRWRWLWQRIADWFGVKVGPYPGHPQKLEERMADKESVWAEIVSKHGLRGCKMADLAPWWHVDFDLARPFEAFSDLNKCREHGFNDWQNSVRSFYDLFEYLRDNKYIP